MSQGQERDYLQYVGSKVPRFIRLAWTIFLVFFVYYLATFMWPDLKLWMHRL